ncbi:hypothetical protein HDK77DRAFT_454277 [Phyllosticta capitalensis]|uniref:Uncharacterized protein n=1 Tax=Phyllosticta capitalensis TaxID=121624 RepID=A0ABR1YDH9_9PEZI
MSWLTVPLTVDLVFYLVCILTKDHGCITYPAITGAWDVNVDQNDTFSLGIRRGGRRLELNRPATCQRYGRIPSAVYRG